MSNSKVVVICLIVAILGGLFTWRPWEPSPYALSCKTDDLGLYDSNSGFAQAVENVSTLVRVDHVTNDLALDERRAALERIVCDKTRRVTLRALALDIFLEGSAIKVVLESGKSLADNWRNPVTKTTGTVAIISNRADDGGRPCYEILTPSTVLGRDDVVSASVEEFCKRDGQWKSTQIIGYLAYQLVGDEFVHK